MRCKRCEAMVGDKRSGKKGAMIVICGLSNVRGESVHAYETQVVVLHIGSK